MSFLLKQALLWMIEVRVLLWMKTTRQMWKGFLQQEMYFMFMIWWICVYGAEKLADAMARYIREGGLPPVSLI